MSYSLLSLSLCALLTDTCKYFGCELGAQTQMAGGRYIVNGAHEGTKLQELLDGFIRRFVLCSECDNPETDLVSHSLIYIHLESMSVVEGMNNAIQLARWSCDTV